MPMGWNQFANQFALGVYIRYWTLPDVVNDEAGGGDEEVVHPVEVPADRLRVHGVVRDSSTGLINHLVNTNGEGGGWWTRAW